MVILGGKLLIFMKKQGYQKALCWISSLGTHFQFWDKWKHLKWIVSFRVSQHSRLETSGSIFTTSVPVYIHILENSTSFGSHCKMYSGLDCWSTLNISSAWPDSSNTGLFLPSVLICQARCQVFFACARTKPSFIFRCAYPNNLLCAVKKTTGLSSCGQTAPQLTDGNNKSMAKTLHSGQSVLHSCLNLGSISQASLSIGHCWRNLTHLYDAHYVTSPVFPL